MSTIPHVPSRDHDAAPPVVTFGLIFDVIEVLRHGYARPAEDAAHARATGATVAAVSALARSFEGRS